MSDMLYFIETCHLSPGLYLKIQYCYVLHRVLVRVKWRTLHTVLGVTPGTREALHRGQSLLFLLPFGFVTPLCQSCQDFVFTLWMSNALLRNAGTPLELLLRGAHGVHRWKQGKRTIAVCCVKREQEQKKKIWSVLTNRQATTGVFEFLVLQNVTEFNCSNKKGSIGLKSSAQRASLNFQWLVSAHQPRPGQHVCRRNSRWRKTSLIS